MTEKELLFDPDSYLSNYYPCRLSYKGYVYSSSEAAYQAAKFEDKTAKQFFSKLTADESRKVAHRITRLQRPDWEQVKYDVMLDVLRAKFTSKYELAKALLDTGDAVLVENTTGWCDNVWGRCSCEKCRDLPSQNLLGKALTQVREELRNKGMGLQKGDFVVFKYKGERKYGRIRLIYSEADESRFSIFVYTEWKSYKAISFPDIVEVIPTVHNKAELKKLQVGSKFYLGSYISADGTWLSRNTVDYPLRWTVIDTAEDKITVLCDWVVECCPLTELDFYIDLLTKEAFSKEDRSIVITTNDQDQVVRRMSIPDMKDVSKTDGNPEFVDSPYLDALIKSDRVKLEVEEKFHYWVSSDNPEINFVAPWGCDYAPDDSDAIGFRPKMVIEI